MRILLLVILLVGAPFIAAEAKAEPPSGTANGPTAPLSPDVAKLQGTWRDGYTLVFDGRDFCADTQPGEWYEGYIEIRPAEEPAQIDFVILVQSGEPNGNTSKGIFYWDGEAIVVLAPSPGEARPQDFNNTDGRVLMRLKRDGTSKHPAAHCLEE